MANPIVLSNGRAFKSAKAATDHFRTILYREPAGTSVDDPVDHDDLCALLERYDTAITDGPPKIGSGIERFERRHNRGVGYTTTGFWVVRSDGSETDFSFPWAIKGEPKPEASQFYEACRNAVAADIQRAKRRHFEIHADENGLVPCDLTGELLAYEASHIDHAYPTFGHLVATFRAARGWHETLPLGTITAPANNQTTTTFIDPEVAEAFRQFHHAAVTMRVIGSKRNLSMSAGQRRPKVQRPVALC